MGTSFDINQMYTGIYFGISHQWSELLNLFKIISQGFLKKKIIQSDIGKKIINISSNSVTENWMKDWSSIYGDPIELIF